MHAYPTLSNAHANSLLCSRLQLCERFLESSEYKAFLERKISQPLHVSYFQKRICSCMVDEKMTQCADSIDTQFNALFNTWKKLVKGWYERDTCLKDDCICKEEGFLNISSQKQLWAFLFQGDCAPQPDPTRQLPRDTSANAQLAYDCVAGICGKDGCLKDKVARWRSCPVQNKEGSADEIKSKKWTPVPRGKAKAAGDEDGDEDSSPEPNTYWVDETDLVESIAIEDIKAALVTRHEHVLSGL